MIDQGTEASITEKDDGDVPAVDDDVSMMWVEVRDLCYGQVSNSYGYF